MRACRAGRLLVRVCRAGPELVHADRALRLVAGCSRGRFGLRANGQPDSVSNLERTSRSMHRFGRLEGGSGLQEAAPVRDRSLQRRGFGEAALPSPPRDFPLWASRGSATRAVHQRFPKGLCATAPDPRCRGGSGNREATRTWPSGLRVDAPPASNSAGNQRITPQRLP
jgi:hypothetical protein